MVEPNDLLRRAAALLRTHQPSRLPSVVSSTHVAQVRAADEAFKGLDARYGGGLMREAVTAQLRHCAELLGARCPESLRPELLTAVGSFAETAGYMAYDDFAYDDAERAYRFALACAEEAENWQLRAGVLCSLAEQTSWCGDPDTALAFNEAPQDHLVIAAAGGRRAPIQSKRHGPHSLGVTGKGVGVVRVTGQRADQAGLGFTAGRGPICGETEPAPRCGRPHKLLRTPG